MAPPKKPARRVFSMEPAFTPEPQEQKTLPDVYAVLRDHVAYAAAIRSEIRQVRREQQEQREEFKMKVSELSSRVDTLISVANDIKRQKDEAVAGSGVVSGSTGQVEDDPEVERLAQRIDDGIAVLRGEKSAGSVQLANSNWSPPADPNAPAQPSPEAQATFITGRDPNEPL